MMWSERKEFEADIDKVKKACAETKKSLIPKSYIFDRKGNRIFRFSRLLDVRDFGIVPKRLPNFLCFPYIFFRIILNKNVFVNLDFLPKSASLIDIGPLMGTRGTQVKVYDFNKNQVFCAYVGDKISERYAAREVEVYEKFSSCLHVPKLIRKIDRSCYLRELIVGTQAKSISCSSLKFIVEDLKTFYSHWPHFDVNRRDYILRLVRSLNDGHVFDKKLISWLAEVALKSQSNLLRLVKAHGDFAEKNILSTSCAFYIIDWERVSYNSATYDICNLFFKRIGLSQDFGDVRNLSSACLSKLQAQVLVSMCGRTESSPIPNYALFLLERAVFEMDLYDGDRSRLHKFATIFHAHVKHFRGSCFAVENNLNFDSIVDSLPI